MVKPMVKPEPVPVVANKPSPEPVPEPEPEPEPTLTKEEILAKIQVVDDAIAQTDAEIERLQAESLCGDGKIYGMEEPQPAQVTPRELKPRPEEVAIYQKNKAKAAKARELLASSLGVECESSYKEAPLYTRVEDAPFFEDNIKRHQVVKKYIAAHIRHVHEDAKKREMEAAVEYRKRMKSWMESNNEAPPRKLKPLIIPELLEPQKRRTRSNREMPAEEDLLEAAQAEEDKIKCLANLPDMIFSEVEKVRDTFRSTNGLIVDPVKEELERAMVNTWSEEEKQTFIEKLVDFSLRPEREGVKKNFYAISRFIPNKTTRDCVRFYYLNKRTPFFKQMYKKFEVKNRKAYSLKNKYRHRDESKREQASIIDSSSETATTYTPTTYPCSLPELQGSDSKKNDLSDDDADQPPHRHPYRNKYIVR